jgi:hypothetical protein
MNRSMMAAAQRHIAELEARVTQQGALVDGLVASNRDANAATRTLRVLEQALALTKQQLQFVLRGAEPQSAG